VQLIEDTTRVEVLAGVTAKLDNRFSFYTQASYQFVTDQANDGSRGAVQGTIGIRYTW
jgi:outer membrane autotransporter protein